MNKLKKRFIFYFLGVLLGFAMGWSLRGLETLSETARIIKKAKIQLEQAEQTSIDYKKLFDDWTQVRERFWKFEREVCSGKIPIDCNYLSGGQEK